MHWQRKTEAALILLLTIGSFSLTGASQAQDNGMASATVTVLLPADAELYFDGVRIAQTGSERSFTTPVLSAGKGFHYNVLARWTENGKAVEQTRKVMVSAGAKVRVVLGDKPTQAVPKEKKKDFSKEMKDEKQVVTTKASKRVPATSINFKQAYTLPFHSLGTLGSRIEEARRKPDPVALAHAASELAVAEKVSGKKASLTSNALLMESAELAKLRRQVAEMKAVFAVKQQIASEEADVNYWSAQSAWADRIAKENSEAVQSNTLPTDAPRKILLNNYTTQYIDLWVNGNYRMQIPPGGSNWCVIEHKFNPTTLTAYGGGDDAVWGPRQIFGAFQTYTWNLQ